MFEYATTLDRTGRDGNNMAILASADQMYTMFSKQYPKSKKLIDESLVELQGDR